VNLIVQNDAASEIYSQLRIFISELGVSISAFNASYSAIFLARTDFFELGVKGKLALSCGRKWLSTS